MTHLTMAASAICRVAGYRDDAAHVDADRRQNSTGADSVDEPLLARHALRHVAWPNDFADPARHIDIRNPFRFHRSRIAHP